VGWWVGGDRWSRANGKHGHACERVRFVSCNGKMKGGRTHQEVVVLRGVTPGRPGDGSGEGVEGSRSRRNWGASSFFNSARVLTALYCLRFRDRGEDIPGDALAHLQAK
jgi:hypothetical protein